MKVFRNLSVLIVMVFFLITDFATADEVRLKNGDRLTGQVVSMEAGTLVLKTAYAGKIAINWTDILSLTTDGIINVVLSDGTSIKGISVPVTEGKIRLETERIEQAVSIDLANVKSMYIKPPPTVKLSVRANLGISVAKGNTDTETYHFDGVAVARTAKNRFTAGGEFNLEYADDDKTAENFLGYMKYDHFLTKKLYLNTNSSFERNTFKDLNLRTTVGAGVGYQFYETELTNLSTELGLAYVNEDFDEAEDNDYPAGRWAFNFDRYLFDKFLQLFHFHSAFMNITDTSDTFVRTRTGLRFPFYKGLNLTAQYEFDWDNSVPAGQDEIDQRYILSLGYFFPSSP
jgi:putative salt-induced outer membrane protein YdiY